MQRQRSLRVHNNPWEYNRNRMSQKRRRTVPSRLAMDSTELKNLKLNIQGKTAAYSKPNLPDNSKPDYMIITVGSVSWNISICLAFYLHSKMPIPHLPLTAGALTESVWRRAWGQAAVRHSHHTLRHSHHTPRADNNATLRPLRWEVSEVFVTFSLSQILFSYLLHSLRETNTFFYQKLIW